MSDSIIIPTHRLPQNSARSKYYALSLFTSTVTISIGVVHFAYWDTAVSALLSILLNYIWIPRYSYVGSAWALLICEVFLNIVTIIFMTRHVGNIYKWSHWLKIMSANLILYGLLYNGLFDIGLFLKISSSLTIYILLIVFLKAFPARTILYFNRGLLKLKSIYAI